jgi:23S rRNA pseudouridine1911/1915/1917 synthase
MTGDQWVWVPFEVDAKYDGYRIDRFLSQRLIAYSRSRVQKILAESRVMIGDRLVRPSAKVRAGEKIRIAYPRRPEEPLAADASIPILHEDDDLIVINKPADLLSHPTDKIVNHTVLGILRQQRPDIARFHLLHRLDRETSGVLVLAKNPEAARSWTRAMEKHQIQKEYIAFVRGIPAPAEGEITWPIGPERGPIRARQWINVPEAVPAITRYTLQRNSWGQVQFRCATILDLTPAVASWSVVRCFPRTGRLHQIRVHLAALGHPILGDRLYTGSGEVFMKMVAGTATAEDRAALGFPRVALHAAAIGFSHPATQQFLRIEAPLAEDMKALKNRPSDAKIASYRCKL